MEKYVEKSVEKCQNHNSAVQKLYLRVIESAVQKLYLPYQNNKNNSRLGKK